MVALNLNWDLLVIKSRRINGLDIK